LKARRGVSGKKTGWNLPKNHSVIRGNIFSLTNTKSCAKIPLTHNCLFLYLIHPEASSYQSFKVYRDPKDLQLA